MSTAKKSMFDKKDSWLCKLKNDIMKLKKVRSKNKKRLGEKMKRYKRLSSIVLILLLSLIYITGCNKTLMEEDIRKLMPDKTPYQTEEQKEKINLSYQKGELSTLEMNTYIRTLLEEYNYEIASEATMKGDDTVFSLSNKKGKTISFTVHEDGKVDIEYQKES